METPMKKKIFIFVAIFILLVAVHISLNTYAFEAKMIGLFYNGLVQIILGNVGYVLIDSPTNKTYNFSKGANYSIDLNISYEADFVNFSYSLYDIKHNKVIYSNVSFFPNTTFSAVRWDNRIEVYGIDNSNGMYNDSVVFFVFVNNSSPLIGDVTPNLYACEDSYFSYIFSASDVDEDDLSAFLNPQYPLNSFYISSAFKINLTTSEFQIFSGILNKEDAGGPNHGYKVYPETISVSDLEYTDTAQTNITVIEVNNAPRIDEIGVHTIWASGENSTFYYRVFSNDSEDGDSDSGNLTFNISFSGTKLFGISPNGVINFTANHTPGGVYYINVSVTDRGIKNPYPLIGDLCGQDGGPITSFKQFSLTITDLNRPPIIVSYYPLNSSFNVSGTSNLYFNLTSYDPDGTIPDVYWYVNDGLERYKTGGNLFDSFSYSFGCGVSGNYSVRAVITDGELNDSVFWNLTVENVPCPIGSEKGGGGGGGGGGSLACTPKWACSDWEICRLLDNSENSLSYSLTSLIKGRCSTLNWKSEFCGFQLRTCNDINKCNSNLTNPGTLRECYYTENPTCSDGIKNCHDGSCEVLVDCGGVCAPCPTCSDGVKNQGEDGIDCGGPCPICFEIPKQTSKALLIYFFIVLFLIILYFVIKLVLRYYRLKKELGKKNPALKINPQA
ncbi:Uncharacterised protein [uncultured archaeon]|nr:Uncharacterised protein [uncultured archaeon]